MGLLILNLSLGFSLILKLFLITRLLIFSCHVFFTCHPVRMAIFLILICSFVRILIFKISYSWIFFLLVLMFLGGVMVIVIYITSLAANEKNPYVALPNNLLFFFAAFLPLIDTRAAQKSTSSFAFVKIIYEVEFFFCLILCFFFLLVTLIRVVKLVKLEEGPLVKRLLKSNL